MSIREIIEKNMLINDETIIWIREEKNLRLVAMGKWNSDDILKHWNKEVGKLTWMDTNEIFLDI